MNFNIVENADDEYDYEAIKKDYANLSIPVKEIRDKHGLSAAKWYRIVKQFKAEGMPLRNKYTHAPREYNSHALSAKNYTKNKIGKFVVAKRIKGKHHYFGTYETEQEAIARVQELRENGWNGFI